MPKRPNANQKACLAKKVKAAATIDGIRKGITALKKAKDKVERRAKKFEPKCDKTASKHGHEHQQRIHEMGNCIANRLREKQINPEQKTSKKYQDNHRVDTKLGKKLKAILEDQE